jgi:RHS repeat-associated protein
MKRRNAGDRRLSLDAMWCAYRAAILAMVRPDGNSYPYVGMGYANPHALTQLSNGLSTTTFVYDNDGNVTQKTTDGTTTTYVWDYANRLTALGVLGATTTYGYDAFGARVLQTGTTTTYIYPNKYYSVASSTGSGAKYATTTSYAFNGDTLLATVDQQTAGGVATGTAKTRYIHPDHLGSTNVVTDENGGLVQTLDYYPYGATRVSVSTSTNQNRKFIGQFGDDLGLSYLNARYYEGARGQFLSQDPVFLDDPRQQNLQDPQSLNAYSYSDDNPITKKDPLGKYVDISGSITVPNIFQPELPGPSLAFDLQADRGGHYSLSASPGLGWGAYAKPFSAYYVPGPVPNDPVTSTAGSDFFLFSSSANNNNGVYTGNPTGYGVGAGADVYVRWPFTLTSNLRQANQPFTFVPNTTISAYHPYSQNTAAIQSRIRSVCAAVQNGGKPWVTARLQNYFGRLRMSYCERLCVCPQ